jgi:molybdenum cofactor cytidylyltransferase
MIVAVIPAAGESKRMGRPKLILPIGGRALIAQVVAALRDGGAEKVIVVTPPRTIPASRTITELVAAEGADVLIPPAQPPDMRASVEWAIAHLKEQPIPPAIVLLAPADSPGISPGLVGKLITRSTTSPGSIVIPVVGDRRGHPIAIPWSIVVEIPKLEAGRGVNALIARNEHCVVPLEVDDASLIADLDTPDDYERWSKLAQGDAEACR